jgi:uncharacterized protein
LVQLKECEGSMLRSMTISALAIDSTNNPIVILKEIEGGRTLPIWIGLLEANAIAVVMEGITFPRPMTHDLIRNIMEMTEVTVTKVEISDLRDNTYYALIYLNYNGKEIPVDARPSDALALSLRLNVPIYAAEKVIDQSVQIDMKAEAADTSEEGKRWQKMLEDLDPDDFDQ